MKTINRIKLRGPVTSIKKIPGAVMFSMSTASSKNGENHNCTLFTTDVVEIKIGGLVSVEGSLEYPKSSARVNVSKLILCN